VPRYNHARADKMIINLDHDGDRHVYCAWDSCELDGYETNKVVINDAAPGYPEKIMRYVFCTERHKQFWINSHRSYGNLPPGYRRSCI
jgi:hypothetical protein